MFNITQLVGINQLGVLSTLEVLVDVFQEAASIKGQKVPVVSVYLKSGQYVQGYLICFSSGPERKSVIVANYKATETAGQDLTYIYVDEISGVTVHEADSIVDHLSLGQINVSLKKTPSIQEVQAYLQNFLKDFNKRYAAKVSAEIANESLSTQNKNELEALYFSATDWMRALRRHAGDEIVQQSLQNTGYKFVFGFGANAKISTADGVNFEIISTHVNDKVERISRFSIEATLKEYV